MTAPKRRTWGGKRVGGGRPPLPAEEKTRSKLITFRLSGDDLEALETIASLEAETLGAVAKALVLEALSDGRLSIER